MPATFDDPNLVSCAGLVPVMRLAEQADLHEIVTEKVHVPTDKGANPAGKVATIVAGMLAGADRIDDLDVVRTAGAVAVRRRVRAVDVRLVPAHVHPRACAAVAGRRPAL